MRKTAQVWTVLSMLEWATGYFEKKNIPDPRLSIEWILADVLGMKRLDLYLQFDRPLSPDELDAVRPLVIRRGLFEPLQYITGSTEFRNVEILVTPDVLIPRSETEQLVELILANHKNAGHDTLHLLDLGTGSGCIPVAIKKERTAWLCTGIDISEKALEIARKNSAHNDTTVSFFQADMMYPEKSKKMSETDWDIIISNPPYITFEEKEHLNRQVSHFEPGTALFHHEPLTLYSRIIKFASKKKAVLYLECNDKTTSEVATLAGDYYRVVTIHKDFDGNPRFISAFEPVTS